MICDYNYLQHHSFVYTQPPDQHGLDPSNVGEPTRQPVITHPQSSTSSGGDSAATLRYNVSSTKTIEISQTSPSNSQVSTGKTHYSRL